MVRPTRCPPANCSDSGRWLSNVLNYVGTRGPKTVSDLLKRKPDQSDVRVAPMQWGISGATGLIVGFGAYALSLPSGVLWHHAAIAVAAALIAWLFLRQPPARRRRITLRLAKIFDADVLTAAFVGAMAALGAYLIPWAGPKLWLPVFLITTAFLIVTAKLRSIEKK